MKKIIIKLILLGVFFSLAGFGAITGANELYWQGKWWLQDVYADFTSKFHKVVKVEVPIQPAEKSIAELVKEYSRKNNIPKLLLMAMIEQESGGRFQTNRIRFEPRVYDQVNKNKFSDSEVSRLWASSIGLMQIIPHFHLNGKSATECNLRYDELFDPEKNIACGAGILRDCLDRRAGIVNKTERFKKCLQDYNGGESYPNEVLARLSSLAIEGVL